MATTLTVSTSALVIIALLALAAGALFIAICLLKASPFDEFDRGFDKNTDLKHYRNESGSITGGVLIALACAGLIGLTSWAAQRTEQAKAEDALPRHLPRVVIDLNDCPPPREGDTDIILLVIKTHADTGPQWTDCIRSVERGWARLQMKQNKLAASGAQQ